VKSSYSNFGTLILLILLKRGMQDVFLFHKSACAFQQGLFIGDEKLDCPLDKENRYETKNS
jgi:hypothetical protein